MISITYIIAEIGINHNGDFELAKQLIKKSKDTGANAVKFQKRNPDVCVPKDQKNKIRETPWGQITYLEYKHRIEFSIDQYKDLEKYAKSLGLEFIVSCWDADSLKLVEENLNVNYHKIASAMANNKQFIPMINETKKPVILSTGMCMDHEIEYAVANLDNLEYILACTSTYPTDVNEVNLKNILTLKERYPGKKIGFSNHYDGHDACIAATAIGAECIEFHITHDRTAFGTDQLSSILQADKLINGIRNIEHMLGDGIKEIYQSEHPIREKLRNWQGW